MTIYRGPGGGGNATTDAEINTLTTLTNQAETAAALAGVSASEAATSASEADTSEAAALASATAAALSEAGATTQAANAAISASEALTSEQAAAISAGNALADAASASLSAADALASETASALSASGAATSESNAAASASSASTSASTATTQASNAASSASAASTSATTASTQASNASASASAAASSASNASTSAANAANSASEAAASAASIDDANLVHKTGNETIGGIKTFSSTIVGSVSGNAATVTTNANLTGAITSVGNVSSLGSFTSAQLAAALTDETGSGGNVFATSPTLITPSLGTPSALVGTNITGTASSLSIGGNAATATAFSGVVGSAPSYACRAWVNFNGTGTVAIRASGNVSSITDNGVGDYTVNFATAMPDANYSVNATGCRLSDKNTMANISFQSTYGGNKTTSICRVSAISPNSFTLVDADLMDVAVFR